MQNNTDAITPTLGPRPLRASRRLVASGLVVLVAAGLVTACGDDATSPVANDASTTTVHGSERDRPGAGDHTGQESPVEDPGPESPAPSADDGPATPVTVTLPPAPPAATPSAELEDGRHFGYLVDYELGSTATVADFDLAQFFTGDEADAAAAEDGVVAPEEDVENDVYIRNASTRVRRVIFRDDAVVTVVDCTGGCTSVAADRATLENRPTPTPVWLTVEGGVVVQADEQYLP